MKRLHRAGRRLLVAGVIAAAAAGTFVVTSLSTAGASARSSASASTSVKPAVPSITAAVAGRLDALALRTATTSGDAEPTSMQAVATSEGTAVTVATPGDSVPGNSSETVYLVVMRGDFTLGNAPVPPGASAPTGHYLTFTVATGSMDILDLGLSNSTPSAALKNIGAVTTLPG